ncbi:MAG: type II secretion system F family protein [Mycobacteriales bacterium]
MRTGSRAALTAALAGLLLLLQLPSAGAAAKGRILEVTSANGTVSLLFSGVDLGAGSTVDPASVKVTVDGTALPTRASSVTAGSAPVRRTAVIAIDTSGSMAGARLAGAKSAAGTFLDSLPTDVAVGLVTFSTTARVDVAPTSDRARVRAAVQGLAATGNTALYDAATLAARTAGASGARTVLLLSDGQDDGSRTSLPSAVAAVRSSGVLLSAVALGPGATGAAPLRQIAGASGGSVLNAPQAGDLAAAFREAARSISQQVLVTAQLPKDFAATSATVTVTASAGGATLTDQVFTSLSKAASAPADYGPRAVSPRTGLLQHKTTLYVATIGLFIGLLALLALGVTRVTTSERTAVRRRLSIYTLTGRGHAPAVKEATVLGDSAVARSAVELAGRVVARRDIDSGLERKLDAAGVPLRPAEWLLLHVGSAVGLAVLLFLLSGADPVATLLGLLVGFAGPFLYLVIKESRRTAAFLAQLPDTLQLVAGSLSAGYSLPQALDAVVREGSQPIAGEFNRALVESRLGVPVEDALEGIATRMQSEDFSWVVMAIRIQREVGGNLAEVLTTVASTLRERERLRRQVKVLSAEGRLSAYILGGLPPVFGLYLVLVRRSYIQVLFTDPIGIFMLVVLVVEITVGAFWLSKVVKVEV